MGSTLDLSTGAVALTFSRPAASEGSDAATTWTGRLKLKYPGEPVDVHLVVRNGAAPSPAAAHNLSRLTAGTLKSILQKAVRRRDVAVALHAASELAVKKWDDLLRRLPIIVLEDSVLCPGFDAVVVLMLAQSAGLPVCSKQIDLVLSVVARCASDDAVDTHAGDGKRPLVNDVKALLAANAPCAVMVRCMQARACMGGMAGDVLMCHAFATRWLTRCSRDQDGFVAVVPPPPPLQLRPFAAQLQGFGAFKAFPDSLAAGIDVHCQPQLFDGVIAKHRVAPEAFAEAMWHFRSGVRLRRGWTNPVAPPEHFWHRAKDDIDTCARRFLQSKCSQ